MNITNTTKLKLIKYISPIFIIGNIIILHYLYIYKTKNTCKELKFDGLISIFISLSIFHILLLVRIWFWCSLIIDENEINWYILETVRDNRLNIPISLIIIQICQGLIGLFTMWIIDTMFIDKSVCIHDRNLINYITYAFLPFIIISIVFYIKCIYMLFIYIFICIIPDRIVNYIKQKFLENRYFENELDSIQIDNQRIYVGNSPECSICYNENCNILLCGHLLCSDCENRILNLECPVCRSRLHVVQSYNDYKIKRDIFIKDILDEILNKIN
jgi:hypothetical protein